MELLLNEKVKAHAGRGIVSEMLPSIILGKHALIVTGARSAKLCGALDDVIDTLKNCCVAYTHYDKVKENPSIESAIDAGTLAREEGCDLIIAIGGGSAIDAAKAAAAFALDESLDEDEIFTSEIKKALPIVAIPTTAGTGSEVNRYSVLTLRGGLKKRTYKGALAYPSVALLDPDYTKTMTDMGAVSCALDAFSHVIESYMSPSSTVSSRELALSGACDILSVIMKKSSNFDDDDRERLLYAAACGGAAIDVTGTGFTHPLGYSVTLSHGIPHGIACGMFFGDYVDYNRKDAEGCRLLNRFFDFCGYSCERVKSRIAELSHVDLIISEEACEEHINRVADAANFKNSPYIISRAEMSEIYSRLFSQT